MAQHQLGPTRLDKSLGYRCELDIGPDRLDSTSTRTDSVRHRLEPPQLDISPSQLDSISARTNYMCHGDLRCSQLRSLQLVSLASHIFIVHGSGLHHSRHRAHISDNLARVSLSIRYASDTRELCEAKDFNLNEFNNTT
ncbi:hypothetical protein PHAVU_007G071200 [Phaseolus vulgaris]|uniref:Uncharacterized protein n=1 Tax=Phaseolus vulgaris TaxID=3885 RepID=V7BEU8_PHAVU|nr:hypothetical protein PHAVU_007G071200g [Phaseolus vulgaris]ESW15418.1 hypothetical protein PHAVU_007G071200g [Phaseolus vulgaris]